MTSFTYTLTCQECGRAFEARRRDAKFCPRGTCRQRHYRERKSRDRILREAMKELVRALIKAVHTFNRCSKHSLTPYDRQAAADLLPIVQKFANDLLPHLEMINRASENRSPYFKQGKLKK